MEVKFSGDTATIQWPGARFGAVAEAWVFVDELITAGEKAKVHKEAERIRLEEHAWDRYICLPGGQYG